MEKGIVSMHIPINCFECKFKKRPFGMSFPEDIICGITEESIFQYKPHNINGKKPEWCPIKEIPARLEELKCPHSMSDYQRKGFSRGWNACLDEIEGSAEK